MSNDLKIAMNDFRNKYPRTFSTRYDHNIFSLTSINFIYFENKAKEEDLDFLDVDGTNDGGIDALFIDENSEANDMIFLQSKYTDEMSNEDIVNAFEKMYRTYLNLVDRKTSAFSPKLNQVYLECKEYKSDEGSDKFVLITKYKANITTKKKIQKSLTQLKNRYDKEFEIFYGDDIEERIETILLPKATVSNGKLKIDDPNNFLINDESIIVNISAESLKDLYLLYGNKLLSLNLRFFTTNRNIDKAISNTITNFNSNFWYFNNGITIVCDDYMIDGKELKLTNFSIINGGQTTNLISKKEFNDFYLICKIIKVDYSCNETEKANFVSKIAESSNQQKPIKQKDMIANRPEQLKLQLQLQKLRPNPIYMVIKRGEKFKDKKNILDWQETTNEEVGQLLLSCEFQQPGTARSSKSQIWNSLYSMIFKHEWNSETIKDLLQLSNLYSEFRKKYTNKLSANQVGILRNGLHFTLSLFVLLKKISENENILSEIRDNSGNLENIKSIINKPTTTRLINYTKDDFDSKILKLFLALNTFIADRYSVAKEMHQNKDYPSSNFTKLDSNYYKHVVSDIHNTYQNNIEMLKEIFISSEVFN